MKIIAGTARRSPGHSERSAGHSERHRHHSREHRIPGSAMAPVPMVAAMFAALLAIVAGCTPAPRPSLLPIVTPTAQPPLELELPAAPDHVAPLPPASTDAPLQSSVDDALLAWATERNVAYTDACTRVEPTVGMLCDSPTERDTVRLLGPSANEVWYVVTFAEQRSLDTGTGYRVAHVAIAGQ